MTIESNTEKKPFNGSYKKKQGQKLFKNVSDLLWPSRTFEVILDIIAILEKKMISPKSLGISGAPILFRWMFVKDC